MKRLKKVAVIALLFLFLVNTMGYFVVFKCNQFLIRQEMISQIRSGAFRGNMLLLKISNPEKNKNFRRIENTEFTYCGKLYDVVIERNNGDTAFFYCLRDKKEENLLADYTRFLAHNRGSSPSHAGNPILALLHNLVTQALIQSNPLPVHGQGVTFHFPVFETRIFPVYLVHFSPPPKTS